MPILHMIFASFLEHQLLCIQRSGGNPTNKQRAECCQNHKENIDLIHGEAGQEVQFCCS